MFIQLVKFGLSLFLLRGEVFTPQSVISGGQQADFVKMKILVITLKEEGFALKIESGETHQLGRSGKHTFWEPSFL